MAVKFCGGCNPRYDRGEALERFREIFRDKAEFSYPQEGASYDILLVITGCGACHYEYEEIPARSRVYIDLPQQFDEAVSKLSSLIQ